MPWTLMVMFMSGVCRHYSSIPDACSLTGRLKSIRSFVIVGTLNGTWGPYLADGQGFEGAGKPAKRPHRLNLPSPVRSIR